ncbi:hypothetical protein BpHYR1_044807 [Brachionus plicatilis]|uniref:Uncharacterized protein n=1 Tax=Brachionus plicatilis TaxID=10195 RepID=A0A3M7QHH6_BRAPC|nr:hypothetical protein BpHYR1_044807 [Brachionus plicatilis]
MSIPYFGRVKKSAKRLSSNGLNKVRPVKYQLVEDGPLVLAITCGHIFKNIKFYKIGKLFIIFNFTLPVLSEDHFKYIQGLEMRKLNTALYKIVVFIYNICQTCLLHYLAFFREI